MKHALHAWVARAGLAGAPLLAVAGAACGGASSATATAMPSPSVTASPTVSASPAATPSATPAALPQGVVKCPLAAPAGQHPLGSPGGAGTGQRQDPTLVFCGAGNATIPPGTTRFTTGNNWGLGIADSCPQGTAGEGGMNTVLTIKELVPGGGQGPDSATEQGDWTDGGTTLMAAGGNYQLQVSAASPDCVWQISIYPT